jgi:hypothetical protein
MGAQEVFVSIRSKLLKFVVGVTAREVIPREQSKHEVEPSLEPRQIEVINLHAPETPYELLETEVVMSAVTTGTTLSAVTSRVVRKPVKVLFATV